MNLINDVVVMNMYIPTLVILGIVAFLITQLSVKIAGHFKLLSWFWHPRLIMWSYGFAVYAVLVILYS